MELPYITLHYNMISCWAGKLQVLDIDQTELTKDTPYLTLTVSYGVSLMNILEKNCVTKTLNNTVSNYVVNENVQLQEHQTYL